MPERPRTLVLKTDGINCDEEMAHAFEIAGSTPEIVHVNQLIAGERRLPDYQILAIPGGFSYGDHIRAGIILAVEIKAQLGDQIREFTEAGGIGLGVCNGAQIKTELDGIATLKTNQSGRFRCDWVNLKLEPDNKCKFLTNGLPTPVISLPVAHGEGNFYTTPETLTEIENNKLVVFRYCDKEGNPTQEHPANPNGSLNAIAATVDSETHGFLTIMPHPERFVDLFRHPLAKRRNAPTYPHGLPIFQNMVAYASQS